MNLWTYVHMFCFIIYALAVFYVLVKNPHAVTNWVLAMLFFYFALWSGCSTLLNNTTLGFEPARLIMKIQAIAWASFASFYFLFILYLTNNKKLLSRSGLLIFLLLLPAAFVYKNSVGEMLQCCTPVAYGIAMKWTGTPWSYAYFVYYTLIFIWSAYLLILHRNQTLVKSEQRVVDILLVSITVVFFLGTFISVILNFIGLSVPLDLNVVFLIFVFAFIYCAEKYETFTLSSPRNADRIMELINEGIVLLDKDGNLTTANRAAMEIFGFGGVYDAKAACAFIEKQIKGPAQGVDGAETTNMELVFKDALDNRRIVLISSRIILRENSNSGLVCSIRDITGKKKTEEDLVDTVRELKRSNEDLESFAYVASHDLKEPLRMVTSYVQLIKKKFMDKLGVEGNDFINFATDGAQRMSDLIEGLLNYSRIRRTGRENTMVDLTGEINHVLEVMKFRIIDKKAAVTIAGPMPVISADKIHMEQLFQNLIGNALKFSGSKPPVITINCVNSEGYNHFTVADNGIGIEKMYLEKIFQIFQRLHSRAEYDGTGVGLAICRKIVEAHGGKIWVESDGQGKGSSFHFILPE